MKSDESDMADGVGYFYKLGSLALGSSSTAFVSRRFFGRLEDVGDDDETVSVLSCIPAGSQIAGGW